MPASPPSTPRPAPAAIGFRTLVGFAEGADPAEWGRIRATQLTAGRKLALFLLAVNLADRPRVRRSLSREVIDAKAAA